jgi:hypothetical protein
LGALIGRQNWVVVDDDDDDHDDGDDDEHATIRAVHARERKARQ